MTNKTLQQLLSYAAREKVEKLIISDTPQGQVCHLELPFQEEANFKLTAKTEEDVKTSLRRLLNLAPDALPNNQYHKIKQANYQLNFDLSWLPIKNGEKIIMKIHHKNNRLLSFNQLGWQKEEAEITKKVLEAKSGLIIFSSLARQGRSTTLFSCLKAMDLEKRNAYFLGNQPDFVLDGLTNLSDQKTNWQKVLQHDTDIIVSDDSDRDGLRQAILAAATGRLVIVTLEAGSVFEAIYKLIALGLPASLIIDNLRLISHQQLVPLKKIRGNLLSVSRKRQGLSAKRKLIGAFEVLFFNPQIKQYIKNHLTAFQTAGFWEEFSDLAKAAGFKPRALDLAKKKMAGII